MYCDAIEATAVCRARPSTSQLRSGPHGISRRQNDCTDRAVELLGSGQIQLDSIITHRFELEDTQAAFDLVANYREGVGKALIMF